jgi:hypothetical protein
MTDYDEEVDNKFQQLQSMQERINSPFESAEAISKHLLDVNEYESNGVNLDSARANLNFNELREARSKGYLIQELEEFEKTCNMDMGIQKAKVFGKLGVLNVTSRAKNGWGSILSKTDKHVNIQTAEQYAGEIAEDFNPEVAQDLKSKIPVIGGFLKKKEM